MMTDLLHYFGISPAALLGKGSESHVYALDSTRVVRVYAPSASYAYIRARQNFYSQLAAHNPPFTIPQMLEHGVIDAHPYTIEQRMRGSDFAQVLPRLHGREREHALMSYVSTAAQIGAIQFPDASYGELILPDGAVQRATWSQFLWDRAQQTLHTSYREVVQDVPQLDHILSAFQKQLLTLTTSTKSLVHGDYFPGNVFIDDTLTVYGVGDFGYSTVVGDPHMDIAGAIMFLEVVDGYQPADTHLLLCHIPPRHGHVSAEIIDLYRLYYSLYFSSCKTSDPKTYAWCIQNLRASTQRLP